MATTKGRRVTAAKVKKAVSGGSKAKRKKPLVFGTRTRDGGVEIKMSFK